MSDSLHAHYDNEFGSRDGELYEPLSGFNLAAHYRRISILASLELPDLTDATVVDYGVGAWGFACIFEKLKDCAHPIGVDISEAAIARSAALTRDDPRLAGKTVRYITSIGYEIGLPSESVDVLFCGECIEHVEDTDAFLTELHRIIKPGGTAIFTTPNADPFIYRSLGMKWCVGFEHVALMNYDEFAGHLGRYFEVQEIIGFNQSIHPALDSYAHEELQQQWVATGHDNPRDATSLIAQVRKPIDAKQRTPQKVAWVEAGDMTIEGSSSVVSLHENIDGLMIEPGAWLEIKVPNEMSRCNLIFWSHDWSGITEICCGDQRQTVDLFAPLAGCLRVTLHDLTEEKIFLRPIPAKNPKSMSFQAIIYRANFAGDQASG